MKIAQTQTEHTSSPIITLLTIQWACQNSVKSERSDDVSGSADCATSGFIRTSFRNPAVTGRTAAARPMRTRGRTAAVRSAYTARPTPTVAKIADPATVGPANRRETWPNLGAPRASNRALVPLDSAYCG